MFKRCWWVFVMMAVIGPAIGWIAAAVITYVTPKRYESRAVIEVRLRNPGQAGAVDRATSPNDGWMPRSLATEMEVIKSHNVLEQVVQNLELVSRWSVDRESAIRILGAIVSTSNINGTELIEIRTRCTNKFDAKDITMGVAKSYISYRESIEFRTAEGRMKELQKTVWDQEDKVEDRRKIIFNIVKNKGIHVNMPEDGTKTTYKESAAEPPANALDIQEYIDAKRDLESDAQLLQMMKLKLVEGKISSQMPYDAIVIHDPPVCEDNPISPNITLNLVLGPVLGLLLSPLLALPLAWVLRPKAEPKRRSMTVAGE